MALIDHLSNPGGSGNCSGHGAGLYVVLDDFESETAQHHCTDASTSEFVGAFRPDDPLSAFNGENVHGQWTLTIADTAPGDTGVIHRSYFHYFYNP